MQRIWKMKFVAIRVTIEATKVVTKCLKKNLETIAGIQSIL